MARRNAQHKICRSTGCRWCRRCTGRSISRYSAAWKGTCVTHLGLRSDESLAGTALLFGRTGEGIWLQNTDTVSLFRWRDVLSAGSRYQEEVVRLVQDVWVWAFGALGCHSHCRRSTVPRCIRWWTWKINSGNRSGLFCAGHYGLAAERLFWLSRKSPYCCLLVCDAEKHLVRFRKQHRCKRPGKSGVRSTIPCYLRT